jgi:hypothetical protein
MKMHKAHREWKDFIRSKSDAGKEGDAREWNELIVKIDPLIQQKNILEAYRHVGGYIVAQGLQGCELQRLAVQLIEKYGTGFSRQNLINMRRLNIFFPERQTPINETITATAVMLHPSTRVPIPIERGSNFFSKRQTPINETLTWSHYNEILKAETIEEIEFYKQQAESGNWSVRQLRQQMNGHLYYSVALYMRVPNCS